MFHPLTTISIFLLFCFQTPFSIKSFLVFSLYCFGSIAASIVTFLACLLISFDCCLLSFYPFFPLSTFHFSSPTSSIYIFTFLLSLLFSFPTHNFLYLPSGQSLVLPLSFSHCLRYFCPVNSDSLSFTLSFFFLKLSFLSPLLCFNQLSPHLSIVCQVDMLQMNAQQSMAC